MRLFFLTMVLMIPVLAFSNTSAAIAQSATASQRVEKTVVKYKGKDGKTALELLKAKAKVRTAKSPMGELVEEINGVANNGNDYLFFFVNGSMAKTGAANYVTKKGEVIEWKLITRKSK